MPQYSFETQRDIVVASMALHNYIKQDTIFYEVDMHPYFMPRDIFPDRQPVKSRK